MYEFYPCLLNERSSLTGSVDAAALGLVCSDATLSLWTVLIHDACPAWNALRLYTGNIWFLLKWMEMMNGGPASSQRPVLTKLSHFSLSASLPTAAALIYSSGAKILPLESGAQSEWALLPLSTFTSLVAQSVPSDALSLPPLHPSSNLLHLG